MIQEALACHKLHRIWTSMQQLVAVSEERLTVTVRTEWNILQESSELRQILSVFLATDGHVFFHHFIKECSIFFRMDQQMK